MKNFQVVKFFEQDEAGCFYIGKVSLMNTGLKNNIPYVFKSCPEKEIIGKWLKDHLTDRLESLQPNKFNERGVVCHNHASNVSAYKEL